MIIEFSRYHGFEKLRDEVKKTGKLELPIKPDWPEPLVRVMKNCHGFTPDERPTFAMLLDTLNDILNDTVVLSTKL